MRVGLVWSHFLHNMLQNGPSQAGPRSLPVWTTEIQSAVMMQGISGHSDRQHEHHHLRLVQLLEANAKVTQELAVLLRANPMLPTMMKETNPNACGPFSQRQVFGSGIPQIPVLFSHDFAPTATIGHHMHPGPVSNPTSFVLPASGSSFAAALAKLQQHANNARNTDDESTIAAKRTRTEGEDPRVDVEYPWSNTVETAYDWPDALHQYFLACIFEIGLEAAKPLRLYKKMMSDENATSIIGHTEGPPQGSAESAAKQRRVLGPKHIKSHLQRFRMNMIEPGQAFLNDVIDALSGVGTDGRRVNKTAGAFSLAVAPKTGKDSIPGVSIGTHNAVPINNDDESDGKGRFRWTDELHQLFGACIFELGLTLAKAPMLRAKMTEDRRLACIVPKYDCSVRQLRDRLRRFKLESDSPRRTFLVQLSASMQQAKARKKPAADGHGKLSNPKFHAYPFSVSGFQFRHPERNPAQLVSDTGSGIVA